MKLTPEEIELIRQAQDYCRKRKGESKKVGCPFFFAAVPTAICKLCHKWIGTEYREVLIGLVAHPCRDLPYPEILSRFWRNPKLESAS